MATESVSASEFHELASRYEALERQANSLLAAMSRGRTIRNFLMLALLILVGVLCWTIYSMATRLTSPKFMVQLLEGGKVKLTEKHGAGDAVKKELFALYERTSPGVTKAFQVQAEKDQPKYVAAAEKEWPEFKKSFEKKMEERIREQYAALVTECKPELEKAAPELAKNPEKYKQLEDGLVGAAERIVDRHFKQRVLPLFEKLELNWAHYPAAPKPGEGEESTGMQIAGHMVELLGMAFARGEGLAAIIDVPEKKPIRSSRPIKTPTKTDESSKKGG